MGSEKEHLSANPNASSCCPSGETSVKRPEVIDAILTWQDRLGAAKVRMNIGRMDYKIEPGLYAINNPSSVSPILVSANYKLSFDKLRKELKDIGAWIMVLDTKGINVWCAAGKGTFGTDEIVKRVSKTGLSQFVAHRTLIVPQLGAPGVAAHEVKKRSGFTVVYGPILAKDLPAFLQAGLKATPEMRRVQFPMTDRLALTPMELVLWSKYLLVTSVIFFLMAGFSRDGYSTSLITLRGLPNILLLWSGYLAGGILGPMLLPWLPGKAFALKGLWIGLTLAFLILFLGWDNTTLFESRLNLLAWLFIIPAISSYLTMNFTGASTYTSLSGVLKEMRIAVPLQALCALTGIILWVTGLFY